jgi:hypothetical protein
MAVPADRLVRREDFWQLFGANSLPFPGSEIRADERRSMIEMTERADRFLAVGALLVFVPLGHDVPDKTVRWLDFDLLQAFLTAILALGPAGTLFKTQGRLIEKDTESGLASGNVNGFGLMDFRAGHETLTAELEAGPSCGKGADQEKGLHR